MVPLVRIAMEKQVYMAQMASAIHVLAMGLQLLALQIIIVQAVHPGFTVAALETIIMDVYLQDVALCGIAREVII